MIGEPELVFDDHFVSVVILRQNVEIKWFVVNITPPIEDRASR